MPNPSMAWAACVRRSATDELDEVGWHEDIAVDAVPGADHPPEGLPNLLGLLAPLWACDSNHYMGRRGTSGVRELETKGALAAWLRRSEEAPGTKKGRRRTRELDAEAARVVAAFCGRQPACRVEPSAPELEVLYLTCRSMAAPAVARAVCEQLSWSSGDAGWQPRLRAMCAMEYFAEQGDWGKEVVVKIRSEAEGALAHLACEGGRCAEKAQQVLNTAGRAAPMNVWL
uniref:Uncharacterized protein n=1 Tax=Zooxanthella nutricula TaxID=1333877 RepID=A0A6U9AGI5_9DINO